MGLRRKSAIFGGDSVFRSGAPRPMKMGNTLSPWHYDVALAAAIRSDNQRRTAILHYALGRLTSR